MLTSNAQVLSAMTYVKGPVLCLANSKCSVFVDQMEKKIFYTYVGQILLSFYKKITENSLISNINSIFFLALLGLELKASHLSHISSPR
jgi:hypothetical protein